MVQAANHTTDSSGVHLHIQINVQPRELLSNQRNMSFSIGLNEKEQSNRKDSPREVARMPQESEHMSS